MAKNKHETAPIAPTATVPVPATPIVATPVTAPAKPTIAELKVQLKIAIETGNDNLFNDTVVKLSKAQAEIAKMAAESAKHEAEALAGVREAIAKAIHQAVKSLALDDKLAEVKALGFTYKLDAPDKAGVMVNYQAVELMVPVIKTRGGGTTGGGKSKDEYGMSLGDIYAKFKDAVGNIKALANEGTPDALMALAVDAEGKADNSKSWQVKLAVKKAAIAQKLIVPVK